MLPSLRPLIHAAVRSALLLVVLATADAQVAPGWIATYANPALPNADDATYACAIASNGDVYAATLSRSSSVFLSAFLKYDATGTLLWTRSYTPLDAVYQRAFAAPSGGAYFVGRVDSVVTGVSTFVITHVDAAGNLVWTQTYAILVGFGHYMDSVMNIAGEIVLVGTRGPIAEEDVFVRSYSATGALVFDAQTSSSDYANVYGAAALPSGGVVAVGSDSFGGFVASFSSNGALAWSRTIPNLAWNVAVDRLTGAVAVVEHPPTTVGTFPGLYCFDAAGNPLWSDAIADPSWARAGAIGLTFASDGALWAVGFADIAGASHELALRYDATGARTVTRIGMLSGESAQSVLPGAAGQVWSSVSGDWGGRTRVQQLDALGQLDWRVELGRPGMNLQDSSAGRIVASGSTWVASGSSLDAIVQQLDVRESPDGYCTAQVNSLGCTPALTFAGNSSASESSGFVVSVKRLVNQKSGLFFYGTSGVANVPFHGGTKCVAGPLRRSALLNSSGSASPANDCSGALSVDFNALASNSPALSQPGTTVYVQAWSHDPAAPSTTNLSSALHFVVLP